LLDHGRLASLHCDYGGVAIFQVLRGLQNCSEEYRGSPTYNAPT
jgi:hypothetical protein